MKKKEKYGFIMEIDDNDNITAINFNNGVGPNIAVGQKVISNGRWLVPAEVEGTVIKIYEPFNNGRTDDIISVKFSSLKYPLDMKQKDLKP